MGNKASKTKESAQPKGNKKLQTGPFKFEGESSMFEFPFYIQTPPILAGTKTKQIILLYTNYIGTKETKYLLFDSNKAEIVKECDIKCDETFDVFETVYALNEKENKIYFIENNKEIKAVDLKNNEMISLNKSIETTNDNYAVIKYYNNKLYIFGAEEKSDKDSEFIMVPYSTCEHDIEKFGQRCHVLTLNQESSDMIFLAGGQTDVGVNKRIHCPDDQIWAYNLNAQKWSGYFLAQPTHSNGIINYENRYLFSFGGQVLKNKKLRKGDCIYALALKDNEFKLKKNTWYELIRRLPQTDHFHAIYINGENVVHLFSYKGLYYKLNIEYILDELRVGEDSVQTNGVRVVQPWIQQGKKVLPTKSNSITNMGAKPKPNASKDEQKEQ